MSNHKYAAEFREEAVRQVLERDLPPRVAVVVRDRAGAAHRPQVVRRRTPHRAQVTDEVEGVDRLPLRAVGAKR